MPNKNTLNIKYKKSIVKNGKIKTLLFDVHSSFDGSHYYFFTDRSRLKELKNNPSIAVEVVKTTGKLSEMVQQAMDASLDIRVNNKVVLYETTEV